MTEDFIEDHPNASYEDCVQAFVSPADMAEIMLCDVRKEDILHWRICQKTLRIVAIVAFFVIMATACAAAGYFLHTR